MSDRCILKRVVVVGAGVIGLSVALHLSERFSGELELTLVSDRFPPHTTSDKAGMIIASPEFMKKNPRNQDEAIMRWMRTTMMRYHSIYKSEENAEVEITLQQGYAFLPEPLPDPWWKNDVFGFRHVDLDSKEARTICVPPNCEDIWAFGTYIVDNSSYVCWLLNKVKTRGVCVQQEKISSFDQLSSYDIIINCTGIGSRELVEDKLVYPVRGQVVLVKAPWIKNWLMEGREGGSWYILPRSRNVLLGGTAETGNWSEVPNPTTADRILKNCQRLLPSLSGAEVIGGWAGLRPQRDDIRLEKCKGPGEAMLVHCYGHGGNGVSLSWGSAVDIGDMVQQRLYKN